VLLELLRERLESLTLPGPVCALALEVTETAHPDGQLSLGENAQVREALDGVLARLCARLGPAAVGAPAVRSHRIPECAGGLTSAFDFRLSAFGKTEPEKPASSLQSALRSESRKSKAESLFSDLPSRPLRLTGPEPLDPERDPAGTLVALRHGGRRRRVVDRSQPERLSTGWWDEPAVRDYYTLLLDDGARVWVFRDHADRWWLHGVFD